MLNDAFELVHAQVVVHHIGLLAFYLGLHCLRDCRSVHDGRSATFLHDKFETRCVGRNL